MSELLSPEVQRKLALSSFFGGEGFKIFEEELKQLMLGAEDTIFGLLKEKVGNEKLADLNFKLGRKDGLQKVLFVLEGLKEELQER